MPQALSLHIGLNHVDPAAYGGWDGELAGCVNDANDMEAICVGRGFGARKLIDSDATSDAVLRCIGEAACRLQAGDLFVLTYSGHGGQVRDVDGDEPDAMDETWVLWDRMLVDDEFQSLWSQFAPGARVFMVSDSCHSGTVARAVGYPRMVQESIELHAASQRARGVRDAPAPRRFRLMPPDVNARAVVAAGGDYDSRQWVAGARSRDVGATVILVSGCQDNQLSSDGARNGLFTETLLRVWNGGAFSGGHEAFCRAIQAQMPPNQTPNYYVVGRADPAFEAATPFTVGAAAPAPAVPAPTPTPAPAQPAPTTRPTLRRPASGGNVIYLQNRLVAHGYALTVDGDFGPATEARVCEFQRDRRLFADGVVGRETWAALEAAPTGAVPAQPSPPSVPAPAPSAPSTPAPGTHPLLKLGDQGEEVRYLQRLLVDLDYVLTVDGDFGPTTQSRVRSFQSTNGLTSDGVVGPNTWEALESQAGTRAQPAYAP